MAGSETGRCLSLSVAKVRVRGHLIAKWVVKPLI